jgi:dTDP-4-amino-4,6-dideoxygalactose transaminase
VNSRFAYSSSKCFKEAKNDRCSIQQKARVTQGGFILGDAITDFEKSWCEYTGAKFTLSCSTGTDALVLALKALDIGAGDEVITTAHTFFATTESIMLTGATPILVDVHENNGLINEDLIEDAITENTKAIMPVHLYGQPCNLEKLQEISKKHSLALIEDSAQTHGVRVNGKHLGTIGDMGCYSFYPAKTLGALGDAGAIVTNSEELYQKLIMYRDHGRSDKFNHDYLSGGYRMDAIQADFLRIKVRDFDNRLSGRISAVKQYFEALKEVNEIKLLPESSSEFPLHLFVIKTSKRDELQGYLNKEGIHTGIHYPTTSNIQNAFMNKYGKQDFPASEKFASECLSLPLFNYITSEEVKRVTDAVKSFFS